MRRPADGNEVVKIALLARRAKGRALRKTLYALGGMAMMEAIREELDAECDRRAPDEYLAETENGPVRITLGWASYIADNDDCVKDPEDVLQWCGFLWDYEAGAEVRKDTVSELKGSDGQGAAKAPMDGAPSGLGVGGKPKHDGEDKAVSHADVTDDEQAVGFPELKMTPAASDSGGKTLCAGPTCALVGTVTEANSAAEGGAASGGQAAAQDDWKRGSAEAQLQQGGAPPDTTRKADSATEPTPNQGLTPKERRFLAGLLQSAAEAARRQEAESAAEIVRLAETPDTDAFRQAVETNRKYERRARYCELLRSKMLWTPDNDGCWHR